ncbi:MAG: hypothetical protein IKV62_06930 [Bacteroidales bacterium]|nr:hypothetical protein [Bacteroidales bacterium]
MKRMILWAFALVPVALNAQVADTLYIENPSSVQVVSAPGALSVSVDGTAENPTFHYSNSVKAGSEIAPVSDKLNFETPFTKKKNLSHWKLTLINSEEAGMFGGVIGGGDLFGNAKVNEYSADFGILGVRYYPAMKNNYISFGWNVGYSITRLTGSGKRFSQMDGKLCLTDFPAGVSEFGNVTDILRYRYSFPLQYTCVFGKNLSWRASAGAELHWNYWGETKSNYVLNGNHIVERIDNIKVNPISVDLMGSLSYMGVGLRVRYSPTPAFRLPNGPAYRTWSVGFLFEF